MRTVDVETRGLGYLLRTRNLVSNVCRYVDNFAHGSSQWEGFPITVDVASEAILLGCKVELMGPLTCLSCDLNTELFLDNTDLLPR